MPIKFYKTVGEPKKTFQGSEEVHFSDTGYIYVADNNGNQQVMYKTAIDLITLEGTKNLTYRRIDGTQGKISLDFYTTTESDARYISQTNPMAGEYKVYHEGNPPPGLMTDIERNKLKYIENNAEVNQNAITSIKAGVNTFTAASKEDSLEFFAGENIQLYADQNAKRITISARFSSSLVGPLDNIQNVTITTPSEGEVLQYDATTSQWVNGAYITPQVYLTSPNGNTWALKVQDTGQLFVESATPPVKTTRVDTVVGEQTVSDNTTVGTTTE